MKRYWWLIVAVVVLVVAAAGLGGFVLGGIQSAKEMTVMHATPHQLAEAMQGDRFYSDYGRDALLVSGTVATVDKRGGHLIVGFQTDSAYGASCSLGAATVPPNVGATFTVVTVGGAAERLPAGLQLHDCIVP